MARPTHTKSAQRFLGDERVRVVHDLQNARGACEIEEVLDDGRGVRFEPDSLQQAVDERYTPCHRCAEAY